MLFINQKTLHSEADIITNSSTEIFTKAVRGSKDKIKSLVNALLSIGGSNLTFDDLFTVEYEYSGLTDLIYNYLSYSCKYSDEDATKKTEEYLKQINDDFNPYELEDDISEALCESGAFDIWIKVTPKGGITDKNALHAATILSELNLLFESEER